MQHIVNMSDVLTEFKAYCAELGVAAQVHPDEDAGRRLPLFLRQLYDPFHATLFGRVLKIFVTKPGSHSTPTEIAAHLRTLVRNFGPDVAFVFDAMPAFERNRLLKKGIPFVVPHRQMFLPGKMIELKEVHASAPARSRNALSMPTQAFLLFHLLGKGPDKPASLSEWALLLRYSRMTMTRAHKELVTLGLVEPAKHTRVVPVIFFDTRHDLWNRTVPLLRNPIKKRGYFKVDPTRQATLLEAGLTALSRVTDLADSLPATYARYRLDPIVGPEFISVPFHDEDSVAIEQWWYPPELLADKSSTVDRLSLYLSLRDNQDERVQGALDQMMKGTKW
ncbi:MAG TPA: hypothetical protein VH280_11420 [Verrucomicrobiae bacterium]|jgi:hypothetical protein|nr:hypothetical protein [Verrucomicrobiae bacterium]